VADQEATPTEIASILVALNRIGSEFKPITEDVFACSLLNNIIKTLPTIRGIVQGFLEHINLKAAKENDEANLWNDPDKYPDLQDAKDVRQRHCTRTKRAVYRHLRK
jgi:DNA mismatch repair protein MSH3